MNHNVKIIVATHKDRAMVENNIFHPIQVGASINPYIIKDSYFRDNDGDNISEKNSSFNELSALYWAWKNLDFDIIGLAHYRRYLDINYKKPFLKKDKSHVVRNIQENDQRLINLRNEASSKRKIIQLLKTYDILLPQKTFCTFDNGDFVSLTDQYKRFHIESDWQACVEVIIEKYPEYKSSIEKNFDNGNIFYLCNMFISGKNWFNQYCTWLFDILFEVEKRIKISEDAYQRRVFGFLSERLFTLYILHNKFKIKELPILLIEN